MRHFLICLMSTLLLVAACCPITSVHPLGHAPDEPYDRRLAGIWQLDSAHERVFLHLGRSTEGAWQVAIVEHKADGTMEHERFAITTHAIAPHHYLSLDLGKVSRTNREGQSGHVILKYRLPDSYNLVLERMDLDVVAAAILAGGLAGDVQYDESAVLNEDDPAALAAGKVECAQITDSGDALAGFIARKQPQSLFVPHLTFKRIPGIPLN